MRRSAPAAVTAIGVAVGLVLAAGAATAAWQLTDPCRDLASADTPLATTADDYIGLTLAQAVELAKRRDVAQVRVVCRDRKPLVGTADLRDDRINVGVRGDVVVDAGAF